jgi:2-polyprenyl-6-hydroxyphenyl methylase / 3-demethylubiquinone-9 3-methyltransferase
MAANVNAPEIRRYLSAAPHLSHAGLNALFRQLALEATTLASRDGRRPAVLDLGAGEGSATIAFLDAGAHVTAVDADGARLEVLRERAAAHRASLDTQAGDALGLLERSAGQYDLVAAVSFIHHVEDYAALVEAALGALRPGGVFFSFQDPLLHASLGRPTRAFARVAYLAWRVGQGDRWAGGRRYVRRRLRGYSPALTEDSEEFHAMRGGVDQRRLLRTFAARGIPVRLVLYFSTQGRTFQRIGASLGLENTFALIGGPIG